MNPDSEPIAFAVPSTDKLFSPEARARVVEICTEKNQRFNMQIYSHVGHGFAVSFQILFLLAIEPTSLTRVMLQSRARLSDPYEKWAKEAHFKGFIDWLDFWIAQA